MTYDGFEPLAAKVLQEIASEAQARWRVRVAAAHRLGRLEVGEASVAVACGSAHRAEAFEACRYVVEEIKRRLPIWKKEHFADGRSEWLEGHALAEVR
jgi:molybdopterin synthase catalytic subunit